ncbi:MAG: hypothetical protein ACHP7N_12415 [Caulobacterales bacterium]
MRILVTGTSGSGKTTLGKRLGAELGLPYVELDAINWQPGWRGLDKDDPPEFLRRVDEATAGDGWVCDGNYGGARGMLWRRATHLVWLDYGRSTIMRRVIGRSFLRAIDQRELWAGNREDWRHWLRASHPIRWAWDTWERRRADYELRLKQPEHAHLKVFRLTRTREAVGLGGRIRGDWTD